MTIINCTNPLYRYGGIRMSIMYVRSLSGFCSDWRCSRRFWSCMEIGYSIDENSDLQLSVGSFILVPSQCILMLVKSIHWGAKTTESHEGSWTSAGMERSLYDCLYTWGTGRRDNWHWIPNGRYDLMTTCGLTCDECTHPLDDLVSKKRHSEAGQVLLDYAKDVRQAVIAFVEGNCFSEARRVVSIFETTYLVAHSRWYDTDSNKCSTRAHRGYRLSCGSGW